MSRRLTMADIGKLAGVSASTVSRALSGSEVIPEATRQRILKIVEEHNYVIDAQARSLRLGRSNTVAAVFPFVGKSRRMISDPFYMEMLGAITDALDVYGYDVIVARVPADDADWVGRYARNQRVDGLILVDRAVNDASIRRLQQLGATFVAWGSVVSNQDYPSVGCDSIGGGQHAVKHLIDLGRRVIGFIGGPAAMVETAQRYEGYQAGLAAADLALDPALVAFTDFTPGQGIHAAERLLNAHPDMDGLFVCSDFMSIAIMERLRALGRRVPDDISVVGYDDIQLAAYCSPRLTTIHQPIAEGGRCTVQTLFTLLDEAPNEPPQVILPAPLIIRDSCGANVQAAHPPA